MIGRSNGTAHMSTINARTSYVIYIYNTLTLYIHHVLIPLTKTTAAQTEDALSYYRVRGLYCVYDGKVGVPYKIIIFLKKYSITSVTPWSIKRKKPKFKIP